MASRSLRTSGCGSSSITSATAAYSGEAAASPWRVVSGSVIGTRRVAGISAPTSLAAEFAKANNQTLVGFLRGDRLKRHCEAKLREAQMKVEQIQLQPDGSLSTKPLDPK